MEIRKFEVTVAVPAGGKIPDAETVCEALYCDGDGGFAWEVSEVAAFNVVDVAARNVRPLLVQHEVDKEPKTEN